MSLRIALVVLLWALSVSAAYVAGELAQPCPTPPSAEDIASQLRAALREQDLVTRTGSLTDVLDQLDAASFPLAADVFEQSITDDWDIDLFASAWARVDGPAALSRVDGWPRHKRTAAIPGICRGWALNDPDSAIELNNTLQGKPRLDCSVGIGASWPASERNRLVDWLGTFSQPVERQRVLNRTIAYQLKHEDAEAVIAWVEAMTDGGPQSIKAEAMRRAIRQLAGVDPERTLQWLESHRDAAWAQDSARFLAEPWLLRDPDSATAWVATLPPEESKDTIGGMFRRWLSDDRISAEEWLKAAETSELVEEARRVAAVKIGYKEPLEGLQWCGKIESGINQVDCVEAVARGWFLREPEAARTWLQDSELPGEVQQRVLRPAPKVPAAERYKRRLGRSQRAQGQGRMVGAQPDATEQTPGDAR